MPRCQARSSRSTPPGHERGRHGRQGTRRRDVEDRGIAYTRLLIYRPNSTRNNRSDSRRPSSVNTTDFVLLTGSVMYPFSCSRLMTSQSAFPGSAALVTPEIEQRQNRLVDLSGVDVHGYILGNGPSVIESPRAAARIPLPLLSKINTHLLGCQGKKFGTRRATLQHGEVTFAAPT